MPTGKLMRCHGKTKTDKSDHNARTVMAAPVCRAAMTQTRPLSGSDCHCPLCATRAAHFLTVDGRAYFRCPNCQARFLHPSQFLCRNDEVAHYRHHENDVDDPRYRRFLSKLSEPLIARLPPVAVGLDYGCGPGPALAAMLQEAGYDMSLFDPVFASDPDVLKNTYDFVTCTEVAEHFHHPMQEFARLRRLVRPGGWLAVMTCFQTDDARFSKWHYRKDPTHVVFYREATFRYLAADWGWRCEVPVKDVVLMQAPAHR
ncbi:class I SAM-dependent methyltransferase [Roseinatronobacter alkalisoli]|uniref:Class I SAM-dependent methyltransferase n=1 Tax=Roseinatronobacter alkalisoli TaxID=3028235 RepID=A0ABT5TAZ6_9RHOB|nr:class I SAM-dependent methyltransferase [Roseinatronobacter sp. HJB301]MDD7972282.1 class I SAM-dependent methyltransferase [Roseinatronobacter sp. HJB301]